LNYITFVIRKCDSDDQCAWRRMYEKIT